MTQQVDNRAASGTKRARSEGPRGEGDWTCPVCGNLNFAFRPTCNMRKCGASKPTETTPRHLGPYDQAPPGMYLAGPGVPPLAMGGYPPYPPPVSPVPYDYGGMNVPPPYSPIPLPGAYAPIGVGYVGPGYGVDGYGMMVRGPTYPFMQIQGPRPGVQIEENGSRKRRGGPETSEGDWICPKCRNSNFAFRTVCNMRKCGTPKPAEPVCPNGVFIVPGLTHDMHQVPRIPPQKSSSQGPTPEGSWTCDACGNVNYPFRTKCNRRNCGVEKPADAKLVTDKSPSPN